MGEREREREKVGRKIECVIESIKWREQECECEDVIQYTLKPTRIQYVGMHRHYCYEVFVT